MDNRLVQDIPKVFLGSQFKTNKVETYSSPKVIAQIELNDGGFPKTYAVSLIMAEKDDGGGLDTFIESASRKVADEIGGYLADETDIDDVLDDISDDLWQEIIKTIDKAFEAVFTEIGRSLGLGDDIFPEQTLRVTLPSLDAPFGGSTTSSIQIVKFYEPGHKSFSNGKHLGEFELHYDWHVRTGSLSVDRIGRSSHALVSSSRPSNTAPLRLYWSAQRVFNLNRLVLP